MFDPTHPRRNWCDYWTCEGAFVNNLGSAPI